MHIRHSIGYADSLVVIFMMMCLYFMKISYLLKNTGKKECVQKTPLI